MRYSFRNSPAAVLMVLGLGFLVSGCSSVQENLDESTTQLAGTYQEEVARLQARTDKELGWDEAKAQMLAHNLDLQGSRHDVLRAEESFERVFLDLLPAVNISARMARALTDLGNLNKDDLNVDVFAFVNIPGLVNLRTRYHVTTLGKIRSGWALALKERELTVQLYELFIRSENLALRRAHLEQMQVWASASPLHTQLDANPEMLEREEQLLNLRLEEDRLQETIGELLGSYEHRWILRADDLPQLDYREQPLDLADTAEAAVLVRQLQAAELEAMRLRELGVKLDYWPDISFNFTTPSLYTWSGGNGQSGWSMDDVILSGSSTLRLDTRLQTTYQLRDVRRQLELMKKSIAQEISRRLQRLQQAQAQLTLIDKQLRLTELRLDAMENTPASSELEEWRAQLKKIILLAEQRASLRLRQAQLQALFWVLDDSRWPEQAETFPQDEAPASEKSHNPSRR